MTRGRSGMIAWSTLSVLLALAAPAAGQFAASDGAQPGMPAPTSTQPIAGLQAVGLQQRLGASVPLDLPFRDADGKTVRLQDVMNARPTVLVLAYYNCPMLCTLVLNASMSALGTLPFEAGKDYEFVAVSIDPTEGPSLAAAKKRAYVEHYGARPRQSGVHFLTGSPSSIRSLAAAVGFGYRYDPTTRQYAHPAVITVLTPTGTISRYLYGIEFAPADLRLALVDADARRIGSAVDRALLYCYHYDAATGRYGVAVARVLRIAGAGTICGLAAIVLISARVRKSRRATSIAGRRR